MRTLNRGESVKYVDSQQFRKLLVLLSGFKAADLTSPTIVVIPVIPTFCTLLLNPSHLAR